MDLISLNLNDTKEEESPLKWARIVGRWDPPVSLFQDSTQQEMKQAFMNAVNEMRFKPHVQGCATELTLTNADGIDVRGPDTNSIYVQHGSFITGWHQDGLKEDLNFKNFLLIMWSNKFAATIKDDGGSTFWTPPDKHIIIIHNAKAWHQARSHVKPQDGRWFMKVGLVIDEMKNQPGYAPVFAGELESESSR